MDRNGWIIVVLCVLGLVGWEIYIAKQRQLAPTSTATAVTPSPSPLATFSPTPAPVSAPPVPAPSPGAATLSFAERFESLRNNDLELRLTNRGGGIAEAVLVNYIAEEDRRVTLNSSAHLPIGAIIQDINAPSLPEYTMSREGDAVILEYTGPDQSTIRKRFSFGQTKENKDNYLVNLDVEFTNPTSVEVSDNGPYLALGSSQPIHRNDFSSFTRLVWCVDGKAKGVDVGWFAGGGGILGIGAHHPRPFYSENTKPADWAAVSNQFFTTLVASLDDKSDGVWARSFEIDPANKIFGIDGAMHLPGFKLPPGQTHRAHFELYLGPKLYHRLAQLDHNEAEVMEFGFFKLICQALLNALNTLHSFLGNYAAAIFALTAIIKLALWPLQNRATASARAMAALNPKMQELRVKYKDDPTRMNQELMKLYKQHGVNPVGGCLPMLIQIPIFFGLFTMLRQAVELRGAHFLWIHDLSLPDTVAHIPGVGWPLNVLPLIMAVSSFWMTHLTPKSGDPTQQRMMMFTPVIFIIFCYNFAAALALYYTTQNLLTVLQLYVNQRKQPAVVPAKVTAPAKVKNKRR